MISWGPGLHADLAVEWDGFRAARAALSTVATAAHAQEVAAAHASLWPKLQAQLDMYVRHRSLEVRGASPGSACTLLKIVAVRLEQCSVGNAECAA